MHVRKKKDVTPPWGGDVRHKKDFADPRDFQWGDRRRVRRFDWQFAVFECLKKHCGTFVFRAL
jgi:hypothetical protein